MTLDNTARNLWSLLPAWLHKQELAQMGVPDDIAEDDYSFSHVRVDTIDEAHVICSQGKDEMHRPILDIDFPVHVVPSSTEGHFHLFLDRPMTYNTYMRLLAALANAGIIEQKYASVSEARGYTSVRLPWIRKAKKS